MSEDVAAYTGGKMDIWFAISSTANAVCVIALIKWIIKYNDTLNDQLTKWQVLFESPEASKIVREYASVRIKELKDAGAYKDVNLPG